MLLDLIVGDPQLPIVLVHVFRLLRAMTQGYKELQRRMYDNLDRILNCRSQASGWENDMGHFVAEIFNANREQCMDIKLHQVCVILEDYAFVYLFTMTLELTVLGR